MKVYYAVLQERSMPGDAYPYLAALDRHAAQCGYNRIYLDYARTDVARNELVKTFRRVTSDGDDVFVMLDCDQQHPHDTVARLARRNRPVVGSVAYRRGVPFDPLIQVYRHGKLVVPDEQVRSEHGLLEVATISTGGLAIKRFVFDVLEAAGWQAPFFRYVYKDGEYAFPTEDIYFCFACRDAGIKIYADLDVKSPHLVQWWVDQRARDKWRGTVKR